MKRHVLAGVVVMCAGSVFAQAYPTKPIRMVITYPPGGNTDLVGRAMAAKLS